MATTSKAVMTATCGLLAVCAGTADAATTGTSNYLKFSGIEATELPDNKLFKGYTAIESFSWGITVSGSSHVGGGGGGPQVNVSDFSWTQRVNSIVPDLMSRAMAGTGADFAEMRAGTATGVEYLRLRYEDVLLTGLMLNGGDTGTWLDGSFSFSSFSITVTALKPDGTAGSTTTSSAINDAGWDVALQQLADPGTPLALTAVVPIPATLPLLFSGGARGRASGRRRRAAGEPPALY